MSNPVGKPADTRRLYYGHKFGLSPSVMLHHLPESLLDQLDWCSDDDARRIILGKSK